MDKPGWALSTWGPVELVKEAERIQLRPRERAVLAALAARSPATISVDELATLVWGDTPPKTVRNSIQNHVARIRSVAGDVVVTADGGYRLAAGVIINSRPVDDDSEPFVELAGSEHVDALRESAQAARDDNWITEMSDRLDAGSLGDGIAEVERWVSRHPGDERGVRLLARSLAAAGRRREALASIRDANRQAARSGHAPDRLLRDLERRLLDDDPTLRVPSTDAVDPTAELASPGTSHLVGLDEYLERVERAEETPGVSVVVVSGPAGIGKTTLVEHLRDRADARGRATLLAACSPEPSIPLEPFTEILHQLADRFPKALESLEDLDVLRSLAPTLGVGADRPPSTSSADRSVLLAAISAALRCAPVGVTVVFEDLHWATLLTRQMLDACISGEHDGPPVQIVVTSREADPELIARASEHVVVEPWTLDEVIDYVTRFGRPQAWCREAAVWIHRQSVGTALFIRELTIAAHAASPAESFDAPTSTPANLLSSLRLTLQGVSLSTQRELGGAAVLGRQFRLAEWIPMGLRVEESAAEAVEAGVLERLDRERLVFRHDLLHQLVLDDLSGGQRIEFHDLAVNTILTARSGAGERVEELSHHALAAAALDRTRAVDLLLEAVAVDIVGFAYEAGADKCRSGLALLDQDRVDRSRVEFEVRLGQLLLRLGDPGALDQLLDAARHALDLGDDDLVAEAMREACRLGPTSVVGAVHTEARALLDRAIDSVKDDRAATTVATAGVMLYAISGEYDRCRAFFERAAAYRGDVATRVDALGLAVLVLTERADLERRIEMEHELTELAETIGSEDALWSAVHLRMTNHVQTGDPAMRDTLDELSALTSSLRQRTRLWEFTNWSASVALTDGDPAKAELLATEALGCLDAVAESLVMSAYGAQLLSIRHAQGNVGDLLDTVAAIVDEGDAIGAWHAVLALAAADSGDQARARRHLDIVIADDFAILDRDYTYNGALFAAALAACSIKADEVARIIEPELSKWSGLWGFVGTCTMGPIDMAIARVADLLGDRERSIDSAQRALASAQHARAPIYVDEALAYLEHLGEPDPSG